MKKRRLKLNPLISLMTVLTFMVFGAFAGKVWAASITATEPSTEPTQSEVPVNQVVTVTFSAAMDCTTIDGNTFYIEVDHDANPWTNNQRLTATSVECGGNTASWIGTLNSDQEHYVTVVGGADGVMDTAGEQLEGDGVFANQYKWSFFTAVGGATPLAATIDSPAETNTINAGDALDFQTTVSGGTAPYTYAWDFGGGAADSTTEDPGSVTFSTAGTYTVTLTVTDADSTEAQDSVDVTVNAGGGALAASMDAPSANQTISQGGSVNFQGSASGGTAPYTYAWDFGGGATNSTQQNPGDVTFSTAGTYAVTLTVTDANSDTHTSDPVTVEVVAAGSLVATMDSPSSDTSINAGNAVSFQGSVSGGTSPYTYEWDFGGGAANATVQDPGSVTFSTAGTYTVVFKVTDSGGTMAQDSVVITVNPAGGALTATMVSPTSDVTISQGGTANFQGTVSGGTAPYTYIWDFGGGATNSAQQNPGNVTFSIAGTYDVVFKVTDANSNTATSSPVKVTVNPVSTSLMAVIDSPLPNLTINEGEYLDFQGSVIGGTEPYAYAWDFDGGALASGMEDPGMVEFPSKGSYVVTFEVTDAKGDNGSDSLMITVLEHMIYLTEPADGESDVSASSVIAVTFSRAMDDATLNNSSFFLKTGTSTVPGIVTYSGTTAIFMPDEDLLPNTSYDVAITTDVEDWDGISMQEDYVWSFKTGSGGMVASTHPSGTASDVPVYSVVTASFSDYMDPSSFNTSSFFLETDSGTVSGTVSCNGTTATFTPDSPLLPNTAYHATVTRDVRNWAGEYMAKEYTWSFTTGEGDGTPPAVISSYPVANATDMPVDATITATFSEYMNPSSINTITFFLKTGGYPVSGTVSYSGVTATLTPAVKLSPDTNYEVTITSSVMDSVGNYLEKDHIWSFATGGGGVFPRISSTDPYNNASQVPSDAAVSATFSEYMKPSSINTASFFVRKQDGSSVAGTVTYSGTTASFVASGGLESDTTYYATITAGAEDLDGNSIQADFTWSFTTGSSGIEPPVVYTTFPPEDASGVSPDASVIATFSENMNPSTINTSTFYVKNGLTNVPGRVSYSGMSAVFTPTAELELNTVYYVTVGTGAKDLAGNALESPYSWSFTTTSGIRGDVDGNGNLELADAILALRVLAGLNPPGIAISADTDGDGRIGVAEAVYVIKNISR